MNIRVSSHAFEPGGAIPKEYTGEGRDVSPLLAWSGLPEGTRELALVCDDPDAPTSKPFGHWVLYKIPADRTGPSYAPFAASMRIRTATATINRAKPRRRNISGMRSLRPTPSQAPNTAPKIRVGRLPSWTRPVPR